MRPSICMLAICLTNLARLILTQVAPIGPFRQGTHAMFRHLVYASLVN